MDCEPQSGTGVGEGNAHERNIRWCVQPFVPNKYVICNCAKWHGDTTLVHIRTFEAQDGLQSAAVLLNNQELLTKVQGQDLITLEAKYHKNCMAHILVQADRQREVAGTNNESNESGILVSAFQKLVADVDLLKDGKAFEMTYLSEKYRSYLEESGYAGSDNYRCEKL